METRQSYSDGLAPGVGLVNRHTGDRARVVEVDRAVEPPRVTIDVNQAPGRARDVGATIDGLLEHWRVAV